MVVEVFEAEAGDAEEIADIHLTARREAMPYLRVRSTDADTRAWFGRVVSPGAWWLARCDGRLVGYMKLEADHLDHLYVAPGWQGQGVGAALLGKSKALSPRRLALLVFQRNVRARAFYEAHGFRATGFTDGDNQESEPDARYEWTGLLPSGA